jgi:hypothetical protein
VLILNVYIVVFGSSLNSIQVEFNRKEFPTFISLFFLLQL